MEASQVLAELERAFALKPLPAISPHQAHLADDSLSRQISPEEWLAAGKSDAGRTWTEFTDEELIACDAALAHFDEESFVYYLPAFLGLAVRHCNVDWSHPASFLMGSALHSVTDRSPYSLGRYKKLSPAQREAVVCFLEFMAKRADDFDADLAQKALKRYWQTDEAAKPLIIVP